MQYMNNHNKVCDTTLIQVFENTTQLCFGSVIHIVAKNLRTLLEFL